MQPLYATNYPADNNNQQQQYQDLFPRETRGPQSAASYTPLPKEFFFHHGGVNPHQATVSYSLSHDNLPPPLQSSPASDWSDTPQTLYKMSPKTELGDGDVVVDSDDEDMVVRERTGVTGDRNGDKDKGPNLNIASSRSTNTLPSPTTYTLGDLEKEAVVDEGQRQLFTQKLVHDIKSAALFPVQPHDAMAIDPQSQYRQQAHIPPQQPIQVMSMRQQLPATDVTRPLPPQPAPTVKPISRQPSLHLRPPMEPINPYQRPAIRPPSPFRPYPAAMISPSHLRRFQEQRAPEPTVALRDLLNPNAQFVFGSDPASLADDLASPSEHSGDLEILKEEYDSLYDGSAQLTRQLGEVQLVPSHGLFETADVVEEASEVYVPSHRVGGVKRPSPGDDVDEADSSDSDEDAIGEDDDDEYKAPASTRAAVAAASASPDHLAKRMRTSFGAASFAGSSRTSSSPAPVAAPSSPAPAPSRRGPHASTTNRPRQRHLQPNLVRNNGCLHGCTLTFSTAYEARRHQEDAHGREEAYALIAAAGANPDGEVYPKDYRFLIQIGLHAAGEKTWDSKMKAGFTGAAKAEDEPLDDALAVALVKFAREWSKRYECPRCGTSFSRLDSKKRHFEKQCR